MAESVENGLNEEQWHAIERFEMHIGRKSNVIGINRRRCWMWILECTYACFEQQQRKHRNKIKWWKVSDIFFVFVSNQ